MKVFYHVFHITKGSTLVLLLSPKADTMGGRGYLSLETEMHNFIYW